MPLLVQRRAALANRTQGTEGPETEGSGSMDGGVLLVTLRGPLLGVLWLQNEFLAVPKGSHLVSKESMYYRMSTR